MIYDRVNVSRKIIKKGKKGNAQMCPIALAVTNQLDCALSDGKRLVSSVGVTAEEIVVNLNAGRLIFKTPRAAAAFIRRFDSGSKVSPIDVILRA